MQSRPIDVLLFGQKERDWWQLESRLLQTGCRPWIASTPEEAEALAGRHSFRLILSATPLTQRNPLMRFIHSQCTAFYSIPVDGGCLWCQAVPETSGGPRAPLFRPAEFLLFLNRLIAETAKSLPSRRSARLAKARSTGARANVWQLATPRRRGCACATD